MLVVVAIIALLVSILMPTLNKAKEQTRWVICAEVLMKPGLLVAAPTGLVVPGDWL